MISYSPHDASNSLLPDLLHELRHFAVRYWFEGLVIFALFYLLTDREFTVRFHMIDSAVAAEAAPQVVRAAYTPLVPAPRINSVPVAAPEAPEATAPAASSAPGRTRRVFRHSDYQDLQFLLDPSYAERHQLPRELVDAKLDACRAYVTRFAKVAVAEKERYRIPVAITLAQGLLESENGRSPLATAANNHFALPCGISAEATGCLSALRFGRPAEFQRFDAAWNSFRTHSLLLNSDQYRHLLRLPAGDYRAWAQGLQMAGYSPDPQYAEKLVRLVEGLDLYLFDR